MIEKLVRDRVPDITSISDVNVRSAKTDQEFMFLLRRKLSEEVEEFLESEEMEELADILEVIEALCGTLGKTLSDLVEIKTSKKDRLGGFERRLVLRIDRV